MQKPRQQNKIQLTEIENRTRNTVDRERNQDKQNKIQLTEIETKTNK